LFLKTEKAEHHKHHEHHEHYNYKLAKCGKYKKLLLLFSAACGWPQLFENDDSGVAVKSDSAIGKVFKYLPSLSSADAK
jgi:peptide methionine sulfoxide reductase MsrB